LFNFSHKEAQKARKKADGPASGDQEMQPGLGHQHAGIQSCVGEGRKERFYPYGKTFLQTLREQD
jgi:hypothetical protein